MSKEIGICEFMTKMKFVNKYYDRIESWWIIFVDFFNALV